MVNAFDMFEKTRVRNQSPRLFKTTHETSKVVFLTPIENPNFLISYKSRKWWLLWTSLVINTQGLISQGLITHRLSGSLNILYKMTYWVFGVLTGHEGSQLEGSIAKLISSKIRVLGGKYKE